ncbi:MAG: flagellar hook assembly protein FlgD [Rhodobacteraceae bacterium]|nr:flagellar hook assembly protein FlgD [Paracoccaceae bacterium]
MAISPTTSPISPAASGRSQTQPTVISSDFQTFLRMLTAQIQNQDPLNPTPSDEFAVQLATFSGVEQQVRTNQLLEAIAAQFGGGMAQIAGWVGMEARAEAPVRFDGAPVTLYPNPAPGADRAELVVRNANGREVGRLPVTPSREPIVWDGTGAGGGPVLPGLYSFELVSFTNGMPVASSTPAAYSLVTEARIENGQPTVVLAGGTPVPAASVTALRRPQ